MEVGNQRSAINAIWRQFETCIAGKIRRSTGFEEVSIERTLVGKHSSERFMTARPNAASADVLTSPALRDSSAASA